MQVNDKQSASINFALNFYVCKDCKNLGIVFWEFYSTCFQYELAWNGKKWNFSGLLFHVCGEAVVNVNSNRADRQTDKENYIDFRLRLLGEPGKYLVNYYYNYWPFKPLNWS